MTLPRQESNQSDAGRVCVNDLLLRTLSGESVEKPPVWLMRQAGRYLPEYRKIREKFPDFMDMCRNADATTELAMQPLRRFGFDAAIVFSDILTIADSLNLSLRFTPGKGPILQRPVTQPDAITHLPFDESLERLDYVFAAVRSLRSELGQSLPIIGFSGSPWTQSCYMLSGYSEKDFATAKQFAFSHPSATDTLIDRLALLSADYLYEQYRAGADVLFVIDTWGGILSDHDFVRLGVKPLRRLCDRLLEKNCQAPVMFFSKGLHPERLKPLAALPNLRCIGVDWCQPLPILKQHYPQLTFQGNLDPLILKSGPEATSQAMQILLHEHDPTSHYIAGLGHGILPETPLESVHAFVDAVRNHSPS